jgi:hypothetical protein
MISLSQRPQSDNTRHSHDTDIHAAAGFEPAISAGKRPQTEALDSTANVIRTLALRISNISWEVKRQWMTICQ